MLSFRVLASDEYIANPSGKWRHNRTGKVCATRPTNTVANQLEKLGDRAGLIWVTKYDRQRGNRRKQGSELKLVKWRCTAKFYKAWASGSIFNDRENRGKNGHKDHNLRAIRSDRRQHF